MAKKLDVDIDPGKFLDSFRPEMPAPATTGNKEVKDSCEKIQFRQKDVRQIGRKPIMKVRTKRNTLRNSSSRRKVR